MVDVGIKYESNVEEYLESVTDEIDKELVKSLMLAAIHAEGELKETIAAVFSSGGTGQLSRNPKAVMLQTSGKIKSSAALLDLVYAGIQDEGGVIQAKSTKNLAIPISQEAKVPGKWPRTWAPGRLTFIKSKAGNKLLAEITGKGKSQRIKPHYLLKPQVTIRGKGYVERARKAAEKGIRDIIGKHINIAIQKASA